MPPGLRKMPEPITPPATSMMALKIPSAGISLGCSERVSASSAALAIQEEGWETRNAKCEMGKAICQLEFFEDLKFAGQRSTFNVRRSTLPSHRLSPHV